LRFDIWQCPEIAQCSLGVESGSPLAMANIKSPGLTMTIAAQSKVRLITLFGALFVFVQVSGVAQSHENGAQTDPGSRPLAPAQTTDKNA